MSFNIELRIQKKLSKLRTTQIIVLEGFLKRRLTTVLLTKNGFLAILALCTAQIFADLFKNQFHSSVALFAYIVLILIIINTYFEANIISELSIINRNLEIRSAKIGTGNKKQKGVNS